MNQSHYGAKTTAVFESLESRRLLSVAPFVTHGRPVVHHAAQHAASKVGTPIGPNLAVVSVSPAGNTTTPISTMVVTFDRPIDPFSVDPSYFQLTLPDQSVVPADSVTPDGSGSQLTVAFPTRSTPGGYTFSINSPGSLSGLAALAGLDGSVMAQAYTSSINLLSPTLAPPVITGGGYPVFFATTTPFNTVKWFLGGSAVGSSTADTSGLAALTLFRAIPIGHYSLTATATDNTNHTSALSTPFNFSVKTGAGTDMDGSDPLKRELDVTGTDQSDQILINYVSPQVAQVVLNGHALRVMNFTGRIVVHGLGGNDLIVVDQRLTEDTLLFGDSGSNVILGGGGRDYIVGGSKADSLYGQAGDDTLIGNGGADHLFGGDGQNIFG